MAKEIHVNHSKSSAHHSDPKPVLALDLWMIARTGRDEKFEEMFLRARQEARREALKEMDEARDREHFIFNGGTVIEYERAFSMLESLRQEYQNN